VKIILVIFALSVSALLAFVAYKYFYLDQFNPKLILKIEREKVPIKFEGLTKLSKGSYCACESEIRQLLKEMNIVIPKNRKFLAVANYELDYFKSLESHGVKGNVVRKNDESPYVFIYSYNPRFSLPFDVELKADVVSVHGNQ